MRRNSDQLYGRPLRFVFALFLSVGICVEATTVRVTNRTATVSSASGLHGAFARLKAGSDFNSIEIVEDIFVDDYGFSPLLNIGERSVEVRGTPGVTLDLARTKALLILSDSEVRFVNLTITVEGEYGTPEALFQNAFDVRPSSKVVYENVELLLDSLAYFKVRGDLLKDEQANIASGGDLFVVERWESELISVKNVVLSQNQDKENQDIIPPLTQFTAGTGPELVNALSKAFDDDGLVVEIELTSDIFVAAQDMPNGNILTIKNEVVIQSVTSGGVSLKIDPELSNGMFAEIVPGGQLIYKNVIQEYSETTCGHVCLPTTDNAIRYSSTGFDCAMSQIDTNIVVPCQYIDGLKAAIDEDLRQSMPNGLPAPLMRVTSNAQVPELTFVRFVGHGTCFSNTTVSCNDVTVDARSGGSGSGSDSEEEKTIIIIILAVAGVVLLVCVVAVFLFPNLCFERWLRKKRRKGSVDSMSGSMGMYSDPKGGSVKTYMMGQINGQQLGITDDAVEITEQIASGGYGVVYKGTWKSLPVAIKTVIFQDVADGAGKEKQRAIFEAAISSSIAHQNVVQTYTYSFKQLQTSSALSSIPIRGDSFSRACVDWKLYIVQELCEGGSLRNALKERVLKSCDTHDKFVKGVLQLGLDVAQGLNHLHKHNIVHGDVNTKNVLLREESGKTGGPLDLVAKIADFGLSVKMSYMQSHISNHKAGTPFYMAPEVVQHGVLSKKADVFSYGVVLWEIYHQSCPIQTTGGNGTLQYHEKFPKFPVSCPMLYALLCVVCLSPLPEDRPTFDFILRVLRAIRESVENDKEFLPSKIQKQNLELVQRLNGKTGQELVQFLGELLGEDEGSSSKDNTEEAAALSNSTELNPGPVPTENLAPRKGTRQTLSSSVDPSYSMTITLGSREGQAAWTSDSISFSWDRVSNSEPKLPSSNHKAKGPFQRPPPPVKFPEVPSVGAAILDGMNDDTAFQVKGPLSEIPESPPHGKELDPHQRPHTSFPLRLAPAAPSGQRDMELVNSGSTQRSDGSSAAAGYRQPVREVGLISARSGIGRWSSKDREEYQAAAEHHRHPQQQHEQPQFHHHQQHQQQQQNLGTEMTPGTNSQDYYSVAQHNSDYYSMSIDDLGNHPKFGEHDRPQGS